MCKRMGVGPCAGVSVPVPTPTQQHRQSDATQGHRRVGPRGRSCATRPAWLSASPFAGTCECDSARGRPRSGRGCPGTCRSVPGSRRAARSWEPWRGGSKPAASVSLSRRARKRHRPVQSHPVPPPPLSGRARGGAQPNGRRPKGRAAARCGAGRGGHGPRAPVALLRLRGTVQPPTPPAAL